MQNKTVKWAIRILLAWFILAALGPCTITHKFGPYYGKVVDQDSGEPIAGAVVLVEFRTLLHTLAGFTSHFVNAFETVTNDDGEFHIDAYRAWVFRFPHKWETNCDITVFKPGFGSYPSYPAVRKRYDPGFSIPEHQQVTIGLPKLNTREERQKSLSLLSVHTIPEEKRKELARVIQMEMKNLGYVKYKNPRSSQQ